MNHNSIDQNNFLLKPKSILKKSPSPRYESDGNLYNISKLLPADEKSLPSERYSNEFKNSDLNKNNQELMTLSSNFSPDQKEDDDDNNKNVFSYSRVTFVGDESHINDIELNKKNFCHHANNICLSNSAEEACIHLPSSPDEDNVEKYKMNNKSDNRMMFVSDNIILDTPRPSNYIETSLAELHENTMHRKILSSYSIKDNHCHPIVNDTIKYQQQQNDDTLLTHVNSRYSNLIIKSHSADQLQSDSSLSSDDNLIERNSIYRYNKPRKRHTTNSRRKNKLINLKMHDYPQSTSDDESYCQNKRRNNKQHLSEMDFGEFMLEYQNNGIKKSFEIPQANRSGTKSLSNSRKQECYVTPTKQGQFLLINHPTTNSNDERENDQQYPAIVQNQTSLKSCIRDDIVGMSSIKKLQACFIPKPQPELEKKPTLQSLKSAQIQGLNNNKFVNNNNMSTTMPTTMSSANLMSSNLNKDIVLDTLDILQPINDLSSSSSSSSPLQTLFDIARIKTIDRLSKIDSIRTYIEQQLGVTAFLTLYKLLKSQHPIDMKQKPFCHYISYIPHLCALIVLESEQIRKKLK